MYFDYRQRVTLAERTKIKATIARTTFYVWKSRHFCGSFDPSEFGRDLSLARASSQYTLQSFALVVVGKLEFF